MLPGSNPGWLGRKGEHFLCAQLSPFLTWARILHNDTYASLTEKEETESRNMLQILPPKKSTSSKKWEAAAEIYTKVGKLSFAWNWTFLTWHSRMEKRSEKSRILENCQKPIRVFFRCKSNPIEWENCWTIFSHLLCPPLLVLGGFLWNAQTLVVVAQW